MADENVVEKTETTPAEKTKENEEIKTPEKTEKIEKTKPTEAEVFKAELEKAKAIIGHKEEVIKTEKDKNKELETKLDEAGIDPEEIQTQVKEAIESEVDGLKKGFVTDAIDDEIERVSTSPEETELIKFHMTNSVKLSGTTRKEIRNAVEASKLLANKKKIMSNNVEIAKALQAQITTRTAPESAGEKIQVEAQTDLNSEESELIKKFGDAAKKHVENAPASNVK